MSEDYIDIKIALIGDCGVGKTSLISAFVREEFHDSEDPTIGASYFAKVLNINKNEVKCHIWDTAG